MTTSVLRFSFVAALGAVLAAGGCSGSDDPVGGWKSAEGLFACFHGDGSASFGDHTEEATQVPASYKWTDDGKVTGKDIPPGSTWKRDGGDLVMSLPCMSEGCGTVTFQRDDSLNCK